MNGRAKEYAKMAVRSALYRANLDLGAHPYPVRLVATLRSLEVRTVIDVGANIGQYASMLRTCGYKDRIVSCEPLADPYGVLARRSRSDESWVAVRTALGAKRATTEMNVAGNSVSSSLLEMLPAHVDAEPASRIERAEVVEVSTVTDLLAEYDIDPASTLLKVDTQGYEREVLDGAGDALTRFAAVQLELSFVPLYEGQALFHETVDRLRDCGFTIFGLMPGFCDPADGRMLQCDGLFVLQSRLPASAA